MSDSRCPARFSSYGSQCERPLGHTGMHEAARRTLRWGGRYKRSDLTGKAGAVKDAQRENAARVRRPRGQRCSICCHPGELKNGVCADRIACAERQPYLFGAEAIEPTRPT